MPTYWMINVVPVFWTMKVVTTIRIKDAVPVFWMKIDAPKVG